MRQGTGQESALSHSQARALFLAAADEELPGTEEQKLRKHLEDCEACREGWQDYRHTVQTLRGVRREKAPPALATLVLRRVRRQKRPAVRYAHLTYVQRVPFEAVVPILLGVAVAALIVMAAP